MKGLGAVALLALFVPCPAPGWQTDLMPGDRMHAAILTLDYERPWAGLEIHQGRASGGLPLPHGVWLGGRANALETPTVRLTGLGAWVVVRRGVLLAVDRVETRVDGLEPLRRTDVEGAVQLRSGPASFGWHGRAEGLGSPFVSVWRQWWVGLVLQGAEVAIGRRTNPWSSSPGWAVGVRFTLARGVDSALGWRNGEATLALACATSFARVTTATGWTGARSGGFGFRLQTVDR